MSERSWTITGLNNGVTFFEQIVAVDSIAESEVKALLQRLAARHLSEVDIVASSLGSDYRTALLDIAETEDGPFGFTTDATLPILYTAILGDVPEPEEESVEELVDEIAPEGHPEP